MANKAKHAFGPSQNLQAAIESGLINERDILFLDEDTDNPKVGWISKTGEIVVVKNDGSGDISELRAEIEKKIGAEEVDAKIDQAERAYEKVKYEIADVPTGTLVDYFDKEIRIMCPADTEWAKQAVGAGGDANSNYMTFKTLAPDNAVGYIEHLNGQADAGILTDLKTDGYGRKYQPTWLALAKYDETTSVWSYYGAQSTKDKYIGYSYQIDWYDADNVMIGSDSIRINLSNEDCHNVIEPYYVNNAIATAKQYTDIQIEEAINGAIEIIEF